MWSPLRMRRMSGNQYNDLVIHEQAKANDKIDSSLSSWRNLKVMKNKIYAFVFLIFLLLWQRCHEGTETINSVVIVSICLFNNRNNKCVTSGMIDWCITYLHKKTFTLLLASYEEKIYITDGIKRSRTRLQNSLNAIHSEVLWVRNSRGKEI